MNINKKIIITLGLSSVVSVVALTSMKPQDPGYTNLKVLPKNLTHEQLGKIMHEWNASLGVHCDFCHSRDEATKKMDFASDAKPEKDMAREMFKMTANINEKYFEAKKDSLGMVMNSGINCNTCHNGNAHPEVKVPAMQMGPGGPPPGGVPGPPPLGTPTPPTPPKSDHKEN